MSHQKRKKRSKLEELMENEFIHYPSKRKANDRKGYGMPHSPTDLEYDSHDYNSEIIRSTEEQQDSYYYVDDSEIDEATPTEDDVKLPSYSEGSKKVGDRISRLERLMPSFFDDVSSISGGDFEERVHLLEKLTTVLFAERAMRQAKKYTHLTTREPMITNSRRLRRNKIFL